LYIYSTRYHATHALKANIKDAKRIIFNNQLILERANKSNAAVSIV